MVTPHHTGDGSYQAFQTFQNLVAIVQLARDTEVYCKLVYGRPRSVLVSESSSGFALMAASFKASPYWRTFDQCNLGLHLLHLQEV
jgi:hypothetical protein